MDIKDKDLKKFYQTSLKENPPQLNECPDIEIIVRSFSKEISENEKIKVIDHISDCGICYKKFQAVKQILKESKSLADRFEGLSLSESEVRELKRRAHYRLYELEKTDPSQKKLRLSDKLSALFKLKSSLIFATAIVAIAIAAAALIILLRLPQSMKEGGLRGTKEEKMRLISPREEIQELPLAFEWQPVLGAKEYQVVLLDDELTRIWISDKTDKSQTPIPLGVSSRLLPEKTYYWKVVIHFETGTQKESPLQKFTLSRNPRFTD